MPEKAPHLLSKPTNTTACSLGLQPKVIVVTNVEHDHPDCFPTPKDYEQAFIEFSERLQPGGALIACSDDPGVMLILHHIQGAEPRIVSYGLDNGAELLAGRLERNGFGGFSYSVLHKDNHGKKTKLADLELKVPGEHNVLNSMAAWAVGRQLGLDMNKVVQALGEYQGTGRRFDIRCECHGITVIDDYAHHPTEIRATLAAAHATYPGRRVWAVWQPHTYSRTKTLSGEFLTSFRSAAQVIVTEVYAAREPHQEFSAAELIRPMEHPNARFVPSLDGVVEVLKNELRPGDVLLVLSAGDADQISSEIVRWLNEREGNHA